MKTVADILAAVSLLSDKHRLKNAPKAYVQNFAEAAVRVYTQKDLAEILQTKFLIPADGKFNAETYFKSAAELSVQNHLKLNEHASKVAIEKEVNPPKNKNVEVYYEVGATCVSLEVKCPDESQPSPDAFVFQNVGRVSDRLENSEKFRGLKSIIDNPEKGQKLEFAKNSDNKLKDYLVDANDKFSPNAGVDDLNVLLVACGNCSSIQEWWNYLYASDGLFTAESFYPTPEYRLVDVVLLSNLKYLHSEAYEFHDWTLQNAFLLPCVNPHRRASALSDSIHAGLSVFNHHLTRFLKYSPEPINSRVPDYIMEQVKVRHYVVKHLEESERTRHFPVWPNKKN
jgi:hypothetical protein